LSHQRGKNKKQNKQKQKQNKTKYPKFKCNTFSVSPLACSSISVIVSSKEEKKKKGSVDSSVNVFFEAVAHLPATVSQFLLEALLIVDLKNELNSHLALQALFIKSSPGCNNHCYKLSPLLAHWERWCYACLLRLACLFTVHMGSAPSPLSSGAFLMIATVTSFPTPRLLGGGCHSCLLRPACLFTIQ
jgi:hypothetical protein